MEIYANLPDVLLRIVISYDDRFKYRNGKYMTQLDTCLSKYNPIKCLINEKILAKDMNLRFTECPNIVVLFNKSRLDPKHYHLIYSMFNGMAVYYYSKTYTRQF